ncbi:MAG: hypothetical protein JWQ34_168 [Mucilaginibacter sp.]|uniref:hypothetical protein n=1 Tax=Mucilaginibacter sp. TaxID=1882438 RepID=UPI00262570B0|nr:hypothetical protein [Mucilaginibacter sp.]MDB5001943.1 hypothetical protein [Mucilaginibacter sp.]
MPDIISQDFIKVWQERGINVLFYLIKKWYFLLLALIVGVVVGYYTKPDVKPTYTANISFVLSTGDPRGGNGLSGLAAQLGFDGTGAGGGDNIFSGDNIIELFKSRSLIGSALMAVVDTATHQTLLNYIAQKKYSKFYEKNGPFNNNPKTYSKAQISVYRSVISYVGSSFIVFKKDKKLIFYLISATSTDANTAYYIAKCILGETAQYFIDTKTTISATSVKLLQREADSLGIVLRGTYNSTAAMIDRTYNLNPSISTQRSGTLFSQAKAAAFAGAYTEVMRNLEIAKINLQKETPLYKIIDEPELPLAPVIASTTRYIVFISAIFVLLMLIILVALRLYRINNINDKSAR